MVDEHSYRYITYLGRLPGAAHRLAGVSDDVLV
jgi:hypothetical protein